MCLKVNISLSSPTNFTCLPCRVCVGFVMRVAEYSAEKGKLCPTWGRVWVVELLKEGCNRNKGLKMRIYVVLLANWCTSLYHSLRRKGFFLLIFFPEGDFCDLESKSNVQECCQVKAAPHNAGSNSLWKQKDTNVIK